MSRPRTLVLFDVDGTLIDSQSHILGAMEFAFKARGLLLPPASEILAIVGLSLSEAFAQLCPETDAQERGLLVETYKESFASLRQSAAAAPLYPGALECLEILKDLDDIVLGIATGMSRRGLSHVLSNPDLAGRFVTTQVCLAYVWPAIAGGLLDQLVLTIGQTGWQGGAPTQICIIRQMILQNRVQTQISLISHLSKFTGLIAEHD